MPTFSEPEHFLLGQWMESRLLEDAMKVIREKYEQIFDDVVDEVKQNHPDLNYSKMRIHSEYSGVGIGKAIWPKTRENGWPAGFYLEELRLENLTSPDLQAPNKSVWLYEPKLKEHEARLGNAAEKVLSKAELHRWKSGSDDKSAWLWRPLEPRDTLFQLLLKDGSRGFIDCMVGHFEEMIKLTLAFDEILGTRKQRRS